MLWIILEAVIIYDGELNKRLGRQETLQYYERFLVIAESAYSIRNKFKDKISVNHGNFKRNHK
jgi:hypothetical protein